jgi:hypothetical protein
LKAKKMSLDYDIHAPGDTSTIIAAWFGNFDDKTFILYGRSPDRSCGCTPELSLYHFDFIGGSDCHKPLWLGITDLEYEYWRCSYGTLMSG